MASRRLPHLSHSLSLASLALSRVTCMSCTCACVRTQGNRPRRPLVHETNAEPWATKVKTPTYDADMLVQWRVVKFAARFTALYIARRVAAVLGLQGLDDMLQVEGELDQHQSYLQKRWNHTGENSQTSAPENLAVIAHTVHIYIHVHTYRKQCTQCTVIYLYTHKRVYYMHVYHVF